MISADHMKLQFARLVRHTERATRERDDVAYLDLAHSLRIHVDMKTDVDAYLASMAIPPQFRSISPDRKLKRLLKGSTYTAVALGGRVAGEGKIEGFILTNKVLSEEETDRIYKAGPPTHTTLLTFTDWLGSEIIATIVQPPNQPPRRLGISIGTLIKRVASFLGASHPMGMESSEEYENQFDPHIRALHGMEVLGIPVTYYQLLQVTQTIVETLAPYLGNKTEN